MSSLEVPRTAASNHSRHAYPHISSSEEVGNLFNATTEAGPGNLPFRGAGELVSWLEMNFHI